MAHSWHDGCPVELDQLRLIELGYWDFDGVARTGEIIVNVDESEAVATVFEALFDDEFPIVSIVPIGDLPPGAEDQPDYTNTSGYHCRVVAGTNRWSQHAFGLAIDLNPFQNPLVSDFDVWPQGAKRYTNRDLGELGMIGQDDDVVAAFESIGWGWGGNWSSLKDYHHFSATGS